MTGSLRRAGKLVAFEQGGMTLPEVMVAVIVNAISVSLIAASILAFSSLQASFANSATAAREASVAELRWRSDVREATKFQITDATAITFSLAGSAGSCLERAWVLVPVGARSSLRIVTTTFPGPISSAGCSGSPSGSAATTDLISDAKPSTAFIFTNVGGRSIIHTAGSPRLDTAVPRPIGVSEADWAATAVVLISLVTATNASTRSNNPLVVAQSVATQAASATIPNAPAHYVSP